MRKTGHAASGTENQSLFLLIPVAERVDLDPNCDGKHAHRNAKLIGGRTAIYASSVRKVVLS